MKTRTTDTEAGLLKAILKTPEDDTARLVYADYLDETGRPLEGRPRPQTSYQDG